MDTTREFQSKLDKLMGSTYTSAGSGKHHDANILKQVLGDGAVKIFEDTTGKYGRVEILLPGDRSVVLYKERLAGSKLERFTGLEILAGERVVDAMEILSEDHVTLSPTYRFFYLHNVIGTGKGDVGLYLAQKLLNLPMDQRYLMGSEVEEGVVKAIEEVAGRKVV